jgi:preprotein translocase subunit SecY
MNIKKRWSETAIDFWKKIGITAFLLFVYKFVSMLPIPGLDVSLLKSLPFGGALKSFQIFNTGSLEDFGVGYMNIMPYITCSIFVQMLSSKYGIESFKKYRSDHEFGMVKLNEKTQILTIIVSFLMSVAYTIDIYHKANLFNKAIYIESKISFFIICIFSLMAGALFSLWISNQITRYGIGKGMSVIIFMNILSKFSKSTFNLFNKYSKSSFNYIDILKVVIYLSLVTVFITLIESTYKKIRVKYASNSISATYYLPLKVNNGGIMPPLMVSSLLNTIPILAILLRKLFGIRTMFLTSFFASFAPGGKYYYFIQGFLLLIISYVYVDLAFDPKDISRSLHDSVVLGYRPGSQTEDYLQFVLNFLGFCGGVYYIFIGPTSEYLSNFLDLLVFASPTSIMILVGTIKDNTTKFVYYDPEVFVKELTPTQRKYEVPKDEKKS